MSKHPYLNMQRRDPSPVLILVLILAAIIAFLVLLALPDSVADDEPGPVTVNTSGPAVPYEAEP